jgi:hypothetical protein
MTPTQQALYDLAILMAYSLSKGSPVNPSAADAHALIAAANATCTTDLGGITLRTAAENRS